MSIKFVTKNLNFNLYLSHVTNIYFYEMIIRTKMWCNSKWVRGGATQITLNAHQLTTFKSEKIRRACPHIFFPKNKKTRSHICIFTDW